MLGASLADSFTATAGSTTPTKRQAGAILWDGEGPTITASGKAMYSVQRRARRKGKLMKMIAQTLAQSSSDEEEDEETETLGNHSEEHAFFGDTNTDIATASKGDRFTVSGGTLNTVSEHYFKESKRRAMTSNDQLVPLDFTRLSDEMAHIKPVHQDERTRLLNLHRLSFPEWFAQLQLTNLLFYGYGSKFDLIEEFCSAFLSTRGPVLSICGYHPSVNVRSSLTALADGVNIAQPGSSIEVVARKLLSYYHHNAEARCYIIIHNLDGSGLRSVRCQQALSLLASCPNIHMIASIDHINAPRLWDHEMISRWNWAYHDMTTFTPYLREVCFEQSLLVSQEAAASRGIQYVIRSIPENAQKAFKLLADLQLSSTTKEDMSSSAEAWNGISSTQFYDLCCRQFITANPTSFRTILGELKDHHIIQGRMVAQVEHLLIPQSAPSLTEILADLADLYTA